jgi:hypothetical protein
MDIVSLDFYFPFLVLTYGIVMLLVLEVFPDLVESNKGAFFSPEFYQLMASKKPLAWACFFVGATWSLQNVWL